MRSVLARCAAALLAATAAVGGAWGAEPASLPAMPAAAPVEAAAVPAVSGETVGSVGAAPAESEAHDAPAAEHDAPAEHGEGTGQGEDAGPGEAAGHAAPATVARAPMPFDIIRTLQFLQDQVARGNGRAIRVQAMLLRRFGPTFVEADPAVWNDARNRRAAILLTLSGGPPEVLRRLVAAGAFDEATKPLAEAALAYIANDLKKADKLLSAIDLQAVEPALAAQISLVLGQIEQQDRPAVALAHLDRARLLAPGSLVEEAALRLEVGLTQELGDPAKADRLARRYFDSYARSAYVGNFLARFAMAYSDRPAGDSKASLATIMDITKRLELPEKRELLLAVSRRSLVAGNLELARLTGTEALRIDGAASGDLQRGNLYAAAAGLAASDGAEAADELRAVDRAQLHPADVGILDAATSVLAHMEAPDPDAPAPTDTADATSSPVLDRAQKLLDAVAGDLGEKQ